jgi:hypothetical protein
VFDANVAELHKPSSWRLQYCKIGYGLCELGGQSTESIVEDGLWVSLTTEDLAKVRQLIWV